MNRGSFPATGPSGIRTSDLLLRSRVLYPLGHAPPQSLSSSNQFGFRCNEEHVIAVTYIYVPSLEEFQSAVNGSAYSNSAQLVGREEATPAINSYKHFRFDCSHPGKVFARKTLDSPETELTVMAGQAAIYQLEPQSLWGHLAWMLSASRYLFETIREYVSSLWGRLARMLSGSGICLTL